MAVGLDDFDAEAAAEGVGDVYQNAAPLAQQGGSEPTGAHNPEVPGSTPGPATETLDNLSMVSPPPPAGQLPPVPVIPGYGGGTRTISRKVQSPEQVANQAEQRRIAGEGAKLEQRRGDLAKQQADADSERALQEQEHLEKRSRLITDAINLGDTHITEARNAFREAVESRNGMKLSDPWSNMTTGSKIMALVGMALGGLGSGARGRNDALDILQTNIKQDLDLQRANIAAADDRVVMARTGIRDAQDAKSKLIADVDVNEAAVWKAIEARWRADLAARKVPAAEIDRDARVLAAQKAQADAEQRALGPTVTEVRDTLTNMARGKLRVGGGGSGEPSIKQQGQRAELSAKIDGMVQKVMQNTGYKETAVQNRKYNEMAATLAGAKDNAALAAAGAGTWVKMAQGGTGVISDSDMKQFWGRIGGIPDRVENYIENALSGKMGAEKQKIVADAVRQLARAARGELENIGRQIETRLQGEAEDIPWVKKRIPVYLDTYVPGLKGGKAPPAPQGKRVKLKSGETGILGPDGTFTPDT